MSVVFYRHLEYGNIVLIWLAHMPFILIGDPETVKVIEHATQNLQKKRYTLAGPSSGVNCNASS